MTLLSKSGDIYLYALSFQMGHVYLGFIHALWIFQNSLQKIAYNYVMCSLGMFFLVTLASFLMTSFDLIVNPIFPLTILIAEHFFRACILIVHIDVPKVLY